MTYTMRQLRYPIAQWREMIDRREKGGVVIRVWHLFESDRRGGRETCRRVCGAPAYEVISIDAMLVCAKCVKMLLMYGAR